MKQKRLMLLGGLRYLLPVIEEAHKLGVYVITAVIFQTILLMNIVTSIVTSVL